MTIFKKIFCLCFLAALPTCAFAYVGPGAGLSAIGSILALLGTVLLLIIGFLWYPIKRLIKGNKNEVEGEDEIDDGPGENADNTQAKNAPDESSQ